jgi:hypothetical protein
MGSVCGTEPLTEAARRKKRAGALFLVQQAQAKKCDEPFYRGTRLVRAGFFIVFDLFGRFLAVGILYIYSLQYI